MKRARTSRAAALAAALLGIVGAPSATGAEPDTTAPTIVSFTVAPGSADVTSADGVFTVTLRVADAGSTVAEPSVDWTGVRPRSSGSVAMAQTAGTDRDSTWTGTLRIPRYESPGRYRFTVTVSDETDNSRTYTSDDLAAGGHSSYVDITDADPGTTAPDVTAVSVTPATVDVRGGPATIAFEVTAEDDQSGVLFVSMLVANPVLNNGGANHPTMARVSGNAASGVWRGTSTIPEYARQGRWTFSVIVRDRLGNDRVLLTRQLADAGLADGFEVVSHEDAEAPQFPSVTIEPAEVNVHEADQTVRVRMRVTDNPAGVEPLWDNYHHVALYMEDPTSWFSSGLHYMERTSGDDHDGIYEGSFVVPRSAPSGPRDVWAFSIDRVSNHQTVAGDRLVAAGGVRSILVYNTPLAPTAVSASAGEGSVTVRWGPPSDERGAAITEYVVRESPGGAVVRVPGSAREAVVGGLANGTQHSFTVAAVNKAGESDQSPGVAATPIRAPRSGYWMVGSTGDVYAFGDARWFGNAPVGATPAVDLEPTPLGDGYWVVDAVGHVFTFGKAPYFGGAPALTRGETVTSLSAVPDGGGYWLFTNRGRVLRFGTASFLGDMSGTVLNGPVLDSVATPSGRGYYMVASDGGVFTFGDARFAGSMASTRLNAPVQSLVPDPDGVGYWLVASDGGIFSFDAAFHGSMGSMRLNRPVTGMVGSPTGRGYLMVAEDGGIFTFGDVAFRGSLGSSPPAIPITAAAAAR